MSENIDGPIDWAKTFEHRQVGGKGFVVQDFGRRVAASHATFIAFVLSEFELHSRMINEKLTKMIENNAPQYISETISEIESIRIRVKVILDEYLDKFVNFYSEKLKKAEKTLSNILSNLNSVKEPVSILSEYEKTIKIKKPKGTYVVNLIQNLSAWRAEYLGCYSKFSNENFFEYKRNGTVADLYELWCFYEICAAVKRYGIEEVVQLCAIQRRQNMSQFQIGEHSYVYFDYHTTSFLPVDINKIFDNKGIIATMPGFFVEWFIRNIKEYEKSICIDTKYAKWQSREVLKVLGYMVNFGILNGVLIIRDKIPKRTLGGVSILPELHKVRFPHHNKETLWVVSLKPEREMEKNNIETMNRLIQGLFGK